MILKKIRKIDDARDLVISIDIVLLRIFNALVSHYLIELICF